MIVDHGQWMAKALTGLNVAFEVHLPEVVGRFVFEANPALAHSTGFAGNQIVPMQNIGHRAGRDAPGEQMADLAPTPGGMGVAHSKNLTLKIVGRSCGTGQRASGMFLEACRAQLFEAA
ncbi:hypothetical protein D3C80_1720900 [compost metagenome]